MHFINSFLTGLMLLFMVACQTGNPPRVADLYNEYEQSARDLLAQKSDTGMSFDAADIPPSDAGTIDSFHRAQQIALRHSPRIAVIFADLGIHHAETVQLQLLENPGLELSLMRPESGGRWQMEFSVSLGLLDWLSRQQRVALARSENLRWQAQAWQLLSDEMTKVRHLWLEAVAAQQTLGIYQELYQSASVAEDFALLLFEAGNISELELLSNQSMADQRQSQLIQAGLSAKKSLNDLQHMLGLEGQASISVPQHLPRLSPADADIAQLANEQLLQLAHTFQPALQMSKYELQQSADALALTLRHTALRDAGVELVTERESDGEQQHGFALSLSVPLFDNGDTGLGVMQGHVQRQRIQQQQMESLISVQIRTSLQEMQSSLQQLTLLETDELPRFQRMMDLSLEEYNFMLRGTFDLLMVADLMLDARLRQVDSTQQYWTSYSTLENLVGTSLAKIKTEIKND